MATARPTRIESADIVRTGIQDIDDQHVQLVSLYNRLLEWTERGHALAASFDALTALETYIGKHFDFEETLQARIGFPGRDQHRERHGELADQFAHFSQAIFNGEDLTDQLLHFVSDWIKTHISVEDMEYAHYLIKNEKLCEAGFE